MFNEAGYQSELESLNYDDSSLAWSVRAILENSEMFSNSDRSKQDDDIDRILNDSESLMDLVGSKKKLRKPLSDTISFSRKYYYQFIFLSGLNDEEMRMVMRNFDRFSQLPDLKFFYPEIFNTILKKKINDWCDIKEIEILEKNGDAKYLNIADEILGLYYSMTDFSTDRYPVFNSEAFKSLIRNFCKLSAECVFNPGNVNLNNLLFRQSKTLETLYCMGRIPFQNNEKRRNRGYAYFNVCSPYVAEPFLRTVDNLKRLLNPNSLDCLDLIPELKELRTEIFINKIIKSYMRFTSYNRFENYRVTLNRHNSELLSIPCNELSSIEEVKPLRLFEKIISHFHFRLEELLPNTTEKLTVNVGVIGHAEVSYESMSGFSNEPDINKKEYREIYDLLRMLVDWYNRFGEPDVPKLDLKITFFVSESDVLQARSIDIRESLDAQERIDPPVHYERGGNEGVFCVEKLNYYNEFTFSKRKLLNIINQNDVVFVLDCPWMTMESYELLSDGKLSSYCNFLRRINYYRYKSYLTLDSDRSTDLQYLDAQYNRITSSDSVSSGFISRVFRDDYLRAIVDSLGTEETYDDLGKERKDIYVFTSEKEGVDYSYLGSYPILRKEMYGDKIFTIAHFSNRKSEILKLAKDGEELLFNIRLWSIFKYIAVSYVSVYFRKEIDEVLVGYSLSVEDYFELMRAIVVNLRISYDLNNIVISVVYDESIIGQIQKSLNVGDDSFGTLKNKLHEHLKPFVKALYKDVIFSDYEAFGYDTIRTAFEMNMYGSAKDAESMLFIHFYSKKREKKCISDFIVDFDLEKYGSFKIEEEFRHFKDKRLYQMLFQRLERTNRFDIGTTATLSNAEDLFYDYFHSSVEKALLENIVEACRKTNKTDNDIYMNALVALR